MQATKPSNTQRGRGGAVDERSPSPRFVQLQNPRSKRWVKVDRKNGLIMKTRVVPWANTPIAGKTDLDEATAKLFDFI